MIIDPVTYNKLKQHTKNAFIHSIGLTTSVLDKDLTAPPDSPSANDKYIVGAEATGDWENQDNKFAQYNGVESAWIFTVPVDYSFVYIIDEEAIYLYNDTDKWQLYLKQKFFIIDIQAGAWVKSPSDPAEHEDVSGSNVYMSVDWFDDTTEEFVIGQIKAPPDLDPDGTVYFEAEGYASTADGNEIQLCFYHKARALGENWDQAAYSFKKSGDYATDSNQNELDVITWNETIANLGWSLNDLIPIMLSRCDIDDGTKVACDYGISHFRLLLPRGVN